MCIYQNTRFACTHCATAYVLLEPCNKPKGPPFFYRTMTQYCVNAFTTVVIKSWCPQCEYIALGAPELGHGEEYRGPVPDAWANGR